MNLELQGMLVVEGQSVQVQQPSLLDSPITDPFGQYFPETIFDRLADEEAATTTTCAYNRRANLVAAGTRDGRCLIWDLDTRAMALRLKGHAQPITSVSWTRRGRHVLTSSRDWNCILWDLKTSARRHTVKFTSPVLESQMHPRNKDMFVALAQGDPPSLVQFSKVPGEPPRRIALDMNDTTGLIPGDVESCLKGPAPDIYATTVIFSSDGELIFVGTKKGHISVFESKNGQLKAILRVGTSAVKQVCCSRDGRNLLVNSHDRIIRSFSLKFLDDNTIEFELLNKYQDSVDRNQWTKCCFSSDGDLVVGALSSSQKHNIFIWDKVMGNLVKMLEGPREGLVDMVWHPTRPVIATVSHFGVIYFWGVCYTQNFSAFSPFFTELDDNKEYLEQEDEFDQDSDEDKNAGLAPPRSPMLNVDVVTKDCGIYISDTDDSFWESDDHCSDVQMVDASEIPSDTLTRPEDTRHESVLSKDSAVSTKESNLIGRGSHSVAKAVISYERVKRSRAPFVIPMNL